MNVLKTTWAAMPAIILAALAAACGDSTEGSGRTDAGVGRDAAQADAEPPRAICIDPGFTNPECRSQDDEACDSNEPTVVSNCEFCPPLLDAVCTFGDCESPAELADNEVDQAVKVGFSVRGQLAIQVRRFVQVAVQAETVGGGQLTCEDVRDPDWTFNNPCYNIVDVRSVEAVSDGAEGFSVTFSRFPNNRRMVFIVYGFTNPGATGDPVGVYCTAADIGDPTEEIGVDSEPGFTDMEVF